MPFFNRPRGSSPKERYQVNNMTIAQSRFAKVWQVSSPDDRVLEEFKRLQDAKIWAMGIWDFLHPSTVRGHINAAWKALKMPKLDHIDIVHEHGGWYVTGWLRDNDNGDRRVSYAAVPASGKGSSRGIAFEQIS